MTLIRNGRDGAFVIAEIAKAKAHRGGAETRRTAKVGHKGRAGARNRGIAKVARRRALSERQRLTAEALRRGEQQKSDTGQGACCQETRHCTKIGKGCPSCPCDTAARAWPGGGL